MMLLTSYVSAQTIFLLRDKSMFDVEDDHIGRISSQLSMWSFPFAMVGVFASGYVYDIIGRKWTLFVSFAMASFFIFLIPHTAPHLFSLFIVRILFQISLTGPVSSPLLADYIHKDALGKASALIGMGFVVGEVLAMGILFKITESMSHNAAFLVVAVVGVGVASVFLFIVKEPQLRKSSPG